MSLRFSETSGHFTVGHLLPRGVTVYCPVQSKVIDFSFLVADDADCLPKGIQGLNVAANDGLHSSEICSNLHGPGQLSGFKQDNADTLVFLRAAEGHLLKAKPE